MMQYAALVSEIVEVHRSRPVDIFDLGGEGEYQYVSALKPSYERTLNDIDALFADRDKSTVRVLELGAFLGVVSIGLKRLGYSVEAFDLPEFHRSAKLQQLYREHDIPYHGGNLRHRTLPFEDKRFDLVVMCETLEHLNFNPIPILYEINRISRTNAFLYIAMPNAARLHNRLALLAGRSFYNPVKDFFAQLNPRDNMIVGLHWREYCLYETVEMVESVGYRARSQRYYAMPTPDASPLKRSVRSLAYCYPPFRPFQVVIAEKTQRPSFEFWHTEANM